MKLHLLNDKNQIENIDEGTEGILKHSLFLQKKFLHLKPALNDPRYFPAINFIATIIIFKCCLDDPYDMKNFSQLQEGIKNNSYKIASGWDDEIEKEMKKFSISLAQLNEMELLFLKAVNWDLRIAPYQKMEI